MPRDWVNEAQRRLGEGEASLTDVLPGIIAKILRDGLWRNRLTKDGRPFASFREFCEYKLWWGLECPYERMRQYCDHHDEARRLLAEDVPPLAEHGNQEGEANSRNRGCVTTSVDDARGTATYTLRRLKRDNPELAEKVIKGEMTAHAAAIAAGIRKQKSALDNLMHWWGKADDRERSEFTRWLHGA